MPVLLFGIHVPTVGALFWKADFLSRLDQLPYEPNVVLTTSTGPRAVYAVALVARYCSEDLQ
ncbi:MAG: hypothetical protein ACUVQG_03050 [Thermogutta sp.]